ncbi:hypothetical protein PHLCEN_2v10860 [Hermanssonia centrifuga]|uniref:FAD-binding domain-containing protein n=1 Tax=Hermanssonia centrifuga TaxID=98765 RepID=A0A2R6NLM9_9APHY|nr:hypothetical protein PHLCEN_2v10860 [Hermanssonia centrifuga]
MEKKVAEGLPEFSKYAEPVWTGTIAYRVLVPVDRLPSFVLEKPALKKPLLHVVTYCIAQGTMLNVVALVSQPELSDTVYDGPWATECNPAEMVDSFLDWEPRVREVLKLAEKPIKWAIHDLRPLPIYVSDNVALVGDSAHAMTPHQGSGAGQAIEDAYILGSLLGHPSTTLDTLPHALKAYEHVRLPLANNVLTCSRDAGLIYDFRSECGDDYEAIGATLSHAWDWMGEDGVEEQLQKALSNMMEALK